MTVRGSAVEVLRFIQSQNKIKSSLDGMVLETSLTKLLDTLLSSDDSTLKAGSCIVLKNGRVAQILATHLNLPNSATIVASVTEVVNLWPARTTDYLLLLNTDGTFTLDDDFSIAPVNSTT
jgi:hypothetical protein